MKANNTSSPTDHQSSGLASSAASLLPLWLQGRAGFWVVLFGMYGVVYGSWILFKWGFIDYEALIAGLGYLPLGFFAVFCTLYTALHRGIDPKIRQAWTLIAFAHILWVGGDIVYKVLELSPRGIGFPDIPDILYLGAYPLLFFGLITLPAQLYEPSQKKIWFLDLFIAVTSATAVIWYFIIAPTALAGGKDWFTQLVAGAYPAMDILLLASVARILFRRSESSTHQSILILGIGLLFYIAADLIFARLVLLNAYVSGNWVDILWTLSYFIIGLAALRQAHPSRIQIQEEGYSFQLNWWVSSLPLFALMICILVSAYAVITGNGSSLQTNGLLIGVVFTILLATVRQILTMRENSQLVNELNRNSIQLQINADNLAKLVKERTEDLQTQTGRLHKLRLVGEVSRGLASTRSMDDILTRSPQTILDHFDLSKASIFLTGNDQEFIALAASSTKKEEPMVASVFKSHVKDGSIISRVAVTREPLLFFYSQPNISPPNSHLLSSTCSEMALPLKVENKTIGVLDLQSDQPNAFDEEDISVIQILADQLATAIERARLLQQVEKNLSDLEQAYGQFTREGWRTLGETGLLSKPGYRFDNVRIEPITEAPALGDVALKAGATVMNNHDLNVSANNQVAIPIKLRGQTIGVVTASLKEGYAQTTISTLELAIDRLALSLESARLYEEARLRADREQAIAQVTTNISSTSEFDAILRTTVEEIGRLLGETEVSIQIIRDTDQAIK